MSQGEKHFFEALATDFTTADARQKAAAIGMPWKTAERYLGNFVSRYHVVSRVKNGHYRKC